MTVIHAILIIQGVTSILLGVVIGRMRKRIEALEAAADHRATVEFFSRPEAFFTEDWHKAGSIRRAEAAARRRHGL